MSDSIETLQRLAARLVETTDQYTKLADERRAIEKSLLELAPDQLMAVVISPTLARMIDTHNNEVALSDTVSLLFDIQVPPAEVAEEKQPAEKEKKPRAKKQPESIPAPTVPEPQQVLIAKEETAQTDPRPVGTAPIELKPSNGPSEPITDAVLRDLCRTTAAIVGSVKVRELMGAAKVEGVPMEKREAVAARLAEIIAAGKA